MVLAIKMSNEKLNAVKWPLIVKLMVWFDGDFMANVMGFSLCKYFVKMAIDRTILEDFYGF